MRAVRSRPRECGGYVPAIVATGYCSAADRRELEEAGLCGIIVEPYDTETLVSALENTADVVERLRLARTRTAAEHRRD